MSALLLCEFDGLAQIGQDEVDVRPQHPHKSENGERQAAEVKRAEDHERRRRKARDEGSERECRRDKGEQRCPLVQHAVHVAEIALEVVPFELALSEGEVDA